MKKARILTDIGIAQSQRWVDETIHVTELGPRVYAILNKLPDRVSAVIRPYINTLLFLKKMTRSGVVITANIKTGQLFSAVRSMLGLKKKKHFILELMLDEERDSKRWKIKRWLQRIIFSPVDKIFVSSSREVKSYSERFNLPHDRFKFTYFHTNIINPQIIDVPNGYVLSAGRTGRDYRTFVESVKDLPVDVVLVSDEESIKGLKIPENVKLLIDIPYEEYLEVVEKCFLVVVPLKELVKSTGQVVILEAMALGKPVVATDTVGTRDYIVDNKNGVLVAPNDPEKMRLAISKIIDDEAFKKQLQKNAMKFIMENCTFAKYVDAILSEANTI
ncbi:glycosyltransferase family 4 protein [Thermodesulfobacteriota bacterium]